MSFLSLVTLTFDLWHWPSNSSERGTKHVFPVNLAQICSTVPEMFHTQTKNKCSAVAEAGDRLATTHWHRPKLGGALPLRVELGPHQTQYQVASWSIQPFGHNRHGPKIGGAVPPLFGGRGAGSPSSTMWPGPRPTSLPSGVLIHPAIWPQRIWAENGGLCPFGGGELGPHLTQCGQGQGLPDPSNRLATIRQRYRQDRERSDSIGRTVLEMVAQKPQTVWRRQKQNIPQFTACGKNLKDHGLYTVHRVNLLKIFHCAPSQINSLHRVKWRHSKLWSQYDLYVVRQHGVLWEVMWWRVDALFV